jgi:nitrite reductase/ring-hydroxylating ferredoxin subunit/uncharacterized membrane protein
MVAPTFLENLVERIERLTPLDPAADVVAAAVRKIVRPGAVEDTLTGRQVAHPVHPMLVQVPIGAWLSSLVLDLTGGNDTASRRLVAVGTAAAVPTALTGAADWTSTSGAERRVGLVHALANDVATGLQAASWLARRRGKRVKGVALSAAAMAFAGAGGWLGGHLAYAYGIGVDTTAFQKLPTDWTDAASLDELGSDPLGVEVAGVPVVLFRSGEDVAALAGRCTHRGGPLHEGELADGCLTCPWHGSGFAADGTVRSGPATRPQPALEVRVQHGRIQVRRTETRALRTNPVGT